MFRRRQRRRRRVTEIPQSSLSDMAFLLLIFFITSADIPLEHGLPLMLPSAQKSATLRVLPGDVFHVRAYPGGRVTVDNANVDVSSIGTMLRQKNSQRRLDQEEELIVILETHPEAEYKLMVQILDQIQLADSRRVSLKLLEETP